MANDIIINRRELLDELTSKAKASERLRTHFDLRNSPKDGSQRILNAIEPGTVIPIHRHLSTSETVLCVRGHFTERIYDESGCIVEEIDMLPGGLIINIPAGQWHNTKCLESGTVLLSFKDGAWEPSRIEDILQ